MTTRLQLRRSLAVTAAICAVSVPAAGASPHVGARDAAAVRVDHGLRSPDTRIAVTSRTEQDLRSPDTRDAATETIPARRDLRSPDTRDAVTGAFGALAPVWPVSTSVPSPEPVTPRPDARLPWLLGAALGLLGCAVVIRHSVRRRQRVAA